LYNNDNNCYLNSIIVYNYIILSRVQYVGLIVFWFVLDLVPVSFVLIFPPLIWFLISSHLFPVLLTSLRSVFKLLVFLSSLSSVNIVLCLVLCLPSLFIESQFNCRETYILNREQFFREQSLNGNDDDSDF